MSENNVSFPVAGLLEVTTTEQSNLAIPNGLAEALLVGQYWNQSGLLKQLQQQVVPAGAFEQKVTVSVEILIPTGLSSPVKVVARKTIV